MQTLSFIPSSTPRRGRVFGRVPGGPHPAAAYAAEHGVNVSDEVILTMLGVGASLILCIAHEDNGRFRGFSQSERSNHA